MLKPLRAHIEEGPSSSVGLLKAKISITNMGSSRLGYPLPEAVGSLRVDYMSDSQQGMQIACQCGV